MRPSILRLIASAAVTALLATACTDAQEPSTAVPDEENVGAADAGAVEFAGIALDPDGSNVHEVRSFEHVLGFSEPATASWSGTIRLDLPDGPLETLTVETSSGGLLPHDESEFSFGVVDDETVVVPLVTPGGGDVGALLLRRGAIAKAIDPNGDGAIDVLDVVDISDGTRTMWRTDTGRAFHEAVDRGDDPGCTGTSEPSEHIETALVYDCVTPDRRRPVSGVRALPSGLSGEGLVEIYESADAVGDQPSDADYSAAGERLLDSLEDGGTEEALGVLLNEALGHLMDEGQEETVDAMAAALGLDDPDDEYARDLASGREDIMDALTGVFLDLGGDDEDEKDEDDGIIDVRPEDDEDEDDEDAASCREVDVWGQCLEDDDAGSSWGEPHITPFAGAPYDFQHVGEFVLARSADTEVHVRYESRDDLPISYGAAVGVRVGDRTVTVRQTGFTEADVRVGGEVVDVAEGFDDGVVEVDGRRTTVASPDGTIVSVLVGTTTEVFVLPAAGVVYEGLLGTSPAPDPDAVRVDASASLLPYADGEDTTSFTDTSDPTVLRFEDLDRARRVPALVACHRAGVTDPIARRDCAFDVAVTGDPRFIDDARVSSAVTGTVPVHDLAPVGPLAVPDVAWADAVVEQAAADAGVTTEDGSGALGPPDGRRALIGHSTTPCSSPLVVEFTDNVLRDGDGPDLLVESLPSIEFAYQVWVAAEIGEWRDLGTARYTSVFDLDRVAGPDEQFRFVRFCDDHTDGSVPDVGTTVAAVAALNG